MDRRGCLALCVTFFGFIFTFSACRYDEGGRPIGQRSAERSAGAGLRAWVDPDTGALDAPPDADSIDDASGAAAADTGALQLVPGRTSAGGMMVDLRGHFAHSRRASISSGGRLVARCDLRNEADRGE